MKSRSNESIINKHGGGGSQHQQAKMARNNKQSVSGMAAEKRLSGENGSSMKIWHEAASERHHA